MAEISTTAEIQIEVPAEDVFRWVIEPQNLVFWMNGARQAGWTRRQEADIPRPGDTWAMMYEYGGRENEVVMEVDACDPRTGEFEFHTIEGPYPIRSEYLCQSLQHGTLFRMNQTAYSDSAFTSFMFAITGFISKPMMRKRLQQELERMRTAVELQLAGE